MQRAEEPMAETRSSDDLHPSADHEAFIEAVEAGVAAVRAGDLHPHKEAQRILDAFGE